MTRSVHAYFSTRLLFHTRFPLSLLLPPEMDSKYCSSCTQKRLLSCFLSEASNPASKVLATCASCRATKGRYSKRKALQPLDPNIQPKRRVPRPTKAPTRLNPSILPPNPVEAPPVPAETRPEVTIPPQIGRASCRER